MDLLSVLIVTAGAVVISIYLVRRDRKERAACARTLRRELAELDLRWPVSEASEVAGFEQEVDPDVRRQVHRKPGGAE